jgi:GNAT superfamily N-acetyltransferase
MTERAEITRLTVAEIRTNVVALSRLVRDGFATGAALGFLAPLTDARLAAFWASVADEVAAERRVVLGAGPPYAAIGTVQLILDQADNGGHRCELAKLAVRADARGAGVGRSLVEAAEQVAAEIGRPTIELTTHADTPPVDFYLHLGYVTVGRLPHWAVAPSGEFVDNVLMVKQVS